MPEVARTVAPRASPLVAIEVGVETAEPVLPEWDEPEVEVVLLPL